MRTALSTAPAPPIKMKRAQLWTVHNSDLRDVSDNSFCTLFSSMREGKIVGRFRSVVIACADIIILVDDCNNYREWWRQIMFWKLEPTHTKTVSTGIVEGNAVNQFQALDVASWETVIISLRFACDNLEAQTTTTLQTAPSEATIL